MVRTSLRLLYNTLLAGLQQHLLGQTVDMNAYEDAKTSLIAYSKKAPSVSKADMFSLASVIMHNSINS
jgi:hypothetical protein